MYTHHIHSHTISKFVIERANMNHSFCRLIFTCLKIIHRSILFHWTMIVRNPIHSCERLSTARSLVVLTSHWSALGNGLWRKKWIQSSKREGLGDSVVYNDFVQESSIQKFENWFMKLESWIIHVYEAFIEVTPSSYMKPRRLQNWLD